MFTVSKRVWASFLLVLAVGITLTMVISVSGQKVSRVTKDLVEVQIPRLAQTERLASAISEHERLLYEYYASKDRARLWPQIQQAEKAYLQSFIILDQASGELSLQLSALFDQLKALRNSLDVNLRGQNTHWDLARTHLEDLTKTGKQAQTIFAQIHNEIAAQSEKVSGESSRRLAAMTQMVTIFSVAVIIASALVGYFTQINIRQAAERKTLAQFPERNPSAVISLNWRGQIIYHNPACALLIEKIFGSPQRIDTLIPPHFLNKLKTWQAEHKTHVEFHYKIDQHTLNFDLSLLPDLESCHLYIEDISHRQQAFDQLEFQAYHDQLTKLPNRRSFQEAVDKLVAKNAPFSLLLISLDRFELVQSSQGYEMGDLIIDGMAKRLLEVTDETNQCATLYRMEGTRFCILIESELQSDGERVAKLLQQKMDQALEVEEHRYYFTTSMGICHYPTDADTSNQIIANVNMALNQAKSIGDHYQTYDSKFHAMKQSWLPIESGLRNALQDNQFTLFYQGKVDANSQEVTGAEALIRWFDKENKPISPGVFIPVAEQTGLIIKIGEWVIDESFRQAAQFRRENIDINVAINISARQFQHRHFITKLQDALIRQGISPERIELEITEGLIMQNVEHSVVTMKKIKDLGFRLAIDDFGTGYSSLSYLKKFPIDTLKIDRAFIMNLENDDKDKSIVRSILDLAKHLDLQTVAEGVETDWQWRYLRDMGCDSIQGFYFSKPDTADKLSQVGKGHRLQRMG